MKIRLMQLVELCFSRNVCVCVCTCSVVSDSIKAPWIVAHQAPPSMEFYWHKYWGGLPFPTPGDLPDPT